MSPARPPTIRARRLAGELRRLRELAQLTGDQAARQLAWDPSKISRFETANRSISARDLLALLTLYGVADGKRQALLELAKDVRRRGWWDAYGDSLPTELTTYIAMEAEAVSIREFSAQIVTGLLQTEEYARPLLQAWLMRPGPKGELERRVEARKTRQQLLARDDTPLNYWVVLSEAALRNQVGGPETMRAQCKHLAELSVLPNITIQVLPFTLGAHPATAGTFSILEFPGRYDDDVVYIENMTGAMWVEDEANVHHHTLAFDHLRMAAYGPEKSIALIGEVAAQW